MTECAQRHDNVDSNWYQRKFPGTYVKAGSSKLQNPEYVSGIIKIQMNKLLQLTPEDNVACKRVTNQIGTEQ